MEKKRITVLPHKFENNDYFLLKFVYDEGLISIARSIGCRWVVEEQGWAISRSKNNHETLVRAFGDIAMLDTSKLGFYPDEDAASNKHLEIPRKYEQVLVDQDFPEQKAMVYSSLFRELINYFRNKSLSELQPCDIREYKDYLINVKKVAGSTRVLAFDALRIYFEDVLGWKDFEQQLEPPLPDEKFSDLYSDKEVGRMIHATDNLKHKAILDLLYSTGLASNDIIKLRKDELKLKEGMIRISNEQKDSEKTISLTKDSVELLRKYEKESKPEDLVFRNSEGEPYSNSGVISLVSRLSFRAGLIKPAGSERLQQALDSKGAADQKKKDWGS